MKKRILAAVLTLSVLFGLGGCGVPPSGGGAQESSRGTQESSGGAQENPGGTLSGRSLFLQARKELYDPDLKPSAAAYKVEPDFSNVINYEDFSHTFNDEARRMLLENGFAVMDGYEEEFFGLYEYNRYNYTPNFVTTDSMMHTYHLFFSRLLKGIEKEYFIDGLTQISKIMLEESRKQYEALKDTGWENAAKRNAAFFTVGLALLQDGAEVPAEVKETVEQELALIETAAGIAPSPIMNLGGEGGLTSLEEDYTQYIPRGYYAASEELTRYFKAMMWYGRLCFRQSDDDQSRSALLMTAALSSTTALEQWEKIYSITSFFVGVSDDPGIYEYTEIIQKAYGGWPHVEKLPEKQEEWTAFSKAIKELEPPAINSIPIYDASIQPDKEKAIHGFRFMGQRFTLDAAIFQQLVYRNVEENSAGERRMLPSALDIPSALGSPTAEKILADTGAEDFPGYKENMSALQEYLKDPPDALWNASLYGGWLNTLRPLTAEKSGGYPQFMQNEAWAAKSLNTFLGSWTELKHDTVLYAKQVYAEMGGVGPEEKEDDRGYVEPEPALYSRLAALSSATAEGLKHYGVLRDADAESLGRMAELAQKLLKISEKELTDQLLDDEEYELIRSYGGQLEHFWYEALRDEKNGGEIMSTDFPAAIVTDVATDPNGRVLEVGSGRIDNLYVIVNVGGSLRIAQGGVYSFYEFEQPIDERLTDEKWRKMLGIDCFDEEGNYVDESVDIPRPAWTSLFHAGSNQ